MTKDRETLTTLAWARERFANTFEIVATKVGEDRERWLEDARYWADIVRRLETAPTPEETP